MRVVKVLCTMCWQPPAGAPPPAPPAPPPPPVEKSAREIQMEKVLERQRFSTGGDKSFMASYTCHVAMVNSDA